MAGKSKIEHLFRVRRYTGGKPITDIWLIAREGACEWAVMHGEVSTAEANSMILLFTSLAITVEEETSPMAGQPIHQRKKK